MGQSMSPASFETAAKHYCQRKNYTFIGDLGRGAFKCAYLIDLPNGSKAALKVAELVATSAERLLREIAALQACDHQSIAHLIEIDRIVADGQAYLIVVEEYLSGGTLESRMNSPMPPPQILGIGSHLASVIAHLHEKKLVHRDIKPANILFRADDLIPVLTDFGLVRVLDSPSLTQDFLGQGPGTPFYAAPEQLNNEKALIDWRTDQFGLAVVLAHCALGHHPFQAPGLSVRDAIFSVAKREKLPLTTIQRLSDLGLFGLVSCMAPWPIERHRKPDSFQRIFNV